MLTKGDFWSPHNILINWQGQTQPAFDVLSNPPGIALFCIQLERYPFRNAIVDDDMEFFGIVVIVGVGKDYQTSLFFPVLWYFQSCSCSFTRFFLPDMPLLALYNCRICLFFSQKKTCRRCLLIGLGFCSRYSAIVPMVSILMALFFPQKKERVQHIIPIYFRDRTTFFIGFMI